ncbi:competence/damage-inducible protein A [Halothiobacillus sp. DCM-1]|uniref:competence/damage-inducible protein A n=1 Tax=Halothiobacillus sp. DCM-1 TaxID=3112558 RepID=UPI00324C2922
MTRRPIGAFIIGDEILSGRRRDVHLSALIERLAPRGLTLDWVQMLSDDAALIERQLRQSAADGATAFCFGGIGATPDDLTRAAAARAFDVPLTRHPEAEARIEAQFGAEARPHRVLMADLPQGAELIPNPVNQVPGFFLRQHFFMPGFPQMAHPMLDWILAQPLAPLGQAQYHEAALWTIDVAESDLMPLMQALCADYPTLKLFSLPTRQGRLRLIELGFKGERAQVDAAMQALARALTQRGVAFQAQRPTDSDI